MVRDVHVVIYQLHVCILLNGVCYTLYIDPLQLTVCTCTCTFHYREPTHVIIALDDCCFNTVEGRFSTGEAAHETYGRIRESGSVRFGSATASLGCFGSSCMYVDSTPSTVAFRISAVQNEICVRAIPGRHTHTVLRYGVGRGIGTAAYVQSDEICWR